MDYPTNSHRNKEAQLPAPTEERRKVEKVVTGVEKTKKKGEFGRLFNMFISEDAPKIKSWVFNDIIMPGVKRAIMGSLDMLIKGGGGSGYTSDYSSKPKVRYSQYAEEPNYRKATGTIMAKNNVEYNDIEYPSRGAAERVLENMRDIHNEFQNVTLAEWYELSGIEHPYTYTKYGWSSLREAEIVRRGDGYFIKLPPATLVTK